jgi:hypothetical protein
MSASDGAPDPHYFEFDLDLGIRSQVVDKLEKSPLLPLSKGTGPRDSGVYALYHMDLIGPQRVVRLEC